MLAQSGLGDPVQFLLNVTRRLNVSSDIDEMLEVAPRLAIPHLADLCSIDLIDAHGGMDISVGLATKNAQDLARARDVSATGRPYHSSANGQPQFTRGKPYEIHSDVDHELLQCKEEEKAALRVLSSLGMHSSASIEMKALGYSVGVMTFASTKSNQYTGTKLLLAEDLALRTARAIQLTRLYEQERDVAAELQKALLPSPARTFEGIDVDRLYVPAKGEGKVGGDWYDAFPVAPNILGVSIGDVAGHGVHSAVQMNVVRQAIRSAAVSGASVSEVLAATNRVLSLEARQSLVTAVYGTVDTHRWRFTYAIAGHPPPILVDDDGSVGFLEFSGPPLATGTHHWDVHEVSIIPGETIVLYTDGLTEFSHNIEEGERRLLGAIRELMRAEHSLSARSIFTHTLGGAEWRDDVALLVLRLTGVEPVTLRVPANPVSCAVLRSGLRRFLDRCPLDEQQRSNVLLAAGEAVANAIEHPQERSDDVVQLKAWLDKTRVTVQVQDSGQWKPQEVSDRGRGIPMMKALVQEVKIWNNDHRTSVELHEPFATS